MNDFAVVVIYEDTIFKEVIQNLPKARRVNAIQESLAENNKSYDRGYSRNRVSIT